MSGELVLGIDGGGSKTLVAVADRSGTVVAQSRGSGINPLDTPDWKTILTLQLAPYATDSRIAAVAAGMPAHGEVETISASQRSAIADVFDAAKRSVLNDVDAAHIGAFAGGPGILILSGTGSMAWARDAEGRSYRTGGWGDVIGDEGSAHWIGRLVLSRVSKSLDGRTKPTRLVDGVFTALGLDRADPVDGLEGWVASLKNPRADIAGLATIATSLAGEGDVGALAIIEAAADELATHVTTIAQTAKLPVGWSYAGGTLNSAALRNAIAARLGVQPVAPKLPPIGGALLAAAQNLGWPTTPEFTARLVASLQSAPARNDQLQTTTN